MGWIGVVTDVGADMLNELIPGRMLYITKVLSGSGSVEQEDMHSQTDLQAVVDEGSVTNVEHVTGGTSFRMAFGPFTNVYTMSEIGLFAKVGQDGEENLLVLIQHDGTGMAIPSAHDFPDFALRVSAVVGISNTDSVSFEVNTGALVSQGQMNLAIKSLAGMTVNQIIALAGGEDE